MPSEIQRKFVDLKQKAARCVDITDKLAENTAQQVSVLEQVNPGTGVDLHRAACIAKRLAKNLHGSLSKQPSWPPIGPLMLRAYERQLDAVDEQIDLVNRHLAAEK